MFPPNYMFEGPISEEEQGYCNLMQEFIDYYPIKEKSGVLKTKPVFKKNKSGKIVLFYLNGKLIGIIRPDKKTSFKFEVLFFCMDYIKGEKSYPKLRKPFSSYQDAVDYLLENWDKIYKEIGNKLYFR